MHIRQRKLIVAVVVSAAFTLGLAGCSMFGGKKKKKAKGCARLAEQINDCGGSIGLHGDEDKIVEKCKKRLKAGDEEIKEALKCAELDTCSKYEECMKKVRAKRSKRQDAERLKKSFAEAKDKLKEGKHYSAEWFCKHTENLTPEMTTWCKGLPQLLYKTLTAELVKARDAGKVTYKETSKCDTMLGYAIKAGKKEGDAAGVLCRELNAVKEYEYLKKSVEQQMAKTRPYLPYNCKLSTINEKTGVKTPFAAKLRKQMIDLCFYKLAKKIFKEEVPKLKRWCGYSVKKIYKAYQELKPEDAEIKKLMEQAATVCEPKKPAAMK